MNPSLLTHLIGPGTAKIFLKAVNHIIPGSTESLVEGIEQFQHSPAYTKMRMEHARDLWDDHKEEVGDFFENIGDTVSETANDLIDNAETALQAAGEFLISLF